MECQMAPNGEYSAGNGSRIDKEMPGNVDIRAGRTNRSNIAGANITNTSYNAPQENHYHNYFLLGGSTNNTSCTTVGPSLQDTTHDTRKDMKDDKEEISHGEDSDTAAKAKEEYNELNKATRSTLQNRSCGPFPVNDL